MCAVYIFRNAGCNFSGQYCSETTARPLILNTIFRKFACFFIAIFNGRIIYIHSPGNSLPFTLFSHDWRNRHQPIYARLANWFSRRRLEVLVFTYQSSFRATAVQCYARLWNAVTVFTLNDRQIKTFISFGKFRFEQVHTFSVWPVKRTTITDMNELLKFEYVNKKLLWSEIDF